MVIGNRADAKVAAYVAPHLVSEKLLLASVDDVFNACMIRGNAADEVMFYGRGAGKPTASALMGDVIDAIQHREKRRELGWSESADLADSALLPMKWYLRGDFTAADAKAVCGEVEEIAPNAVITAAMTEIDAKAAAENATHGKDPPGSAPGALGEPQSYIDG